MIGGKQLLKWHDEALVFGRRHDSFCALSPRANPVLWAAWRKYFTDSFGKLPHWFRIVEDEHKHWPTSTKTWTAPCEWPSELAGVI